MEGWEILSQIMAFKVVLTTATTLKSVSDTSIANIDL
jgi:hypothetical protein